MKKLVFIIVLTGLFSGCTSRGMAGFTGSRTIKFGFDTPLGGITWESTIEGGYKGEENGEKEEIQP